jgi:hypothetical protein
MPPMVPLTFKSLFCEKFGCTPEEYEECAFRKCLFWHARLLAPVARIFKADFFLDDFKFIRYLGDSEGLREVATDMLEFNDFNKGQWRFLRTGLKIRVSGRKAQRLANKLFQEDSEAPTAGQSQ